MNWTPAISSARLIAAKLLIEGILRPFSKSRIVLSLKLSPVLGPEEVKRVLTMATSLQAQIMLTLAYGCGLRAGEVVRLRVGDINLPWPIWREPIKC